MDDKTQEIRMFDSVCMEWAVRNLHQKLVHILAAGHICEAPVGFKRMCKGIWKILTCSLE